MDFSASQGTRRLTTLPLGCLRVSSRSQKGVQVTLAVPVVFLVLPVTVVFALFPGLISIVSLAQ